MTLCRYFFQISAFICLSIICLPSISNAQEKLPAGFTDHGVASPISNHRGIVATTGADGKNIVLAWLFDYRGGYELLMVNAENGKSEEFPIPFPPGGDTPYSSLLSNKNKFYTLFNSYFSEFDPVKKAFTFHSKSLPQMAMAMTEDDKGLIWAVTYPNSGLISYNPETKDFKDYGHIYKQNWKQYPRYINADDKGWIYFGLGETATQIVAFDPRTGKSTPLLSEDKRKKGQPFLYRDKNGKVYGQAFKSPNEPWFELYEGTMKELGKHERRDPVPIITGSQALFHDKFPAGGQLKSLDLVNRKVTIADNNGKNNTYPIDYASEGALVMDVFKLPNGTIAGGTAFPMRLFNYDPAKDKWINEWALGQFNVGTNLNQFSYFGTYPGGLLTEWDRSKPFFNDKNKQETSNPRVVSRVSPTIHRPFCVLAYPDGKTIVMGGTPAYGYTGGGLLFWNKETNQSVILKDSALVLDQSAMSLIPLPNNELLVGTTTEPGTGGEKKAKLAEMYIIDINTKKIKWRAPIIPDAHQYTTMYLRPDGLVYGIADRKTFFVFNPKTKKVVYSKDLSPEFGQTVGGHSSRNFIVGEKGEIFLLFHKAIGKIDAKNYGVSLVTEIPKTVYVGGDYANGRIYFILGSRLISYDLKHKK